MDRLRAAGCVFAEDEAALLEAAAISPGHLESMVRQRVSGQPLEVVLGWAHFAGRRITVRAGVFVPRARSELLVREAVTRAPPGALVLDLCCGSGAIGAAVQAARPDLTVHAADLDPVAVACARTNLAADRVHLGDLFEALPATLRGRLDVVVVNAPYVPTRAIAVMPPEARVHEPRAALDGGPDGLDLHRRIAAAASDWLAEPGVVLIEASRDQADTSAAIFAAAGFVTGIAHDDDLDATAVVATAV